MPVFCWTPTLVNVINIPHQETAGARINICSQGTSAISSSAQTSHWGPGKSEEQWLETWVFLIQRASVFLQLGSGCGRHGSVGGTGVSVVLPACSSISHASGFRSFSLPGLPLAFSFPPLFLFSLSSAAFCRLYFQGGRLNIRAWSSSRARHLASLPGYLHAV